MITLSKPFFRIGEVAALIGELQHTIRFWEEQFRLYVGRSKRGQRVYSKAVVVRLATIKQLLREEGYTIRGARQALNRAKVEA